MPGLFGNSQERNSYGGESSSPEDGREDQEEFLWQFKLPNIIT